MLHPAIIAILLAIIAGWSINTVFIFLDVSYLYLLKVLL